MKRILLLLLVPLLPGCEVCQLFNVRPHRRRGHMENGIYTETAFYNPLRRD